MRHSAIYRSSHLWDLGHKNLGLALDLPLRSALQHDQKSTDIATPDQFTSNPLQKVETIGGLEIESSHIPVAIMSQPALNKIAHNSPSRQHPSELETSIATALYELETNIPDLKAALRPLQFVSAREVRFSPLSEKPE